MAIPPNFRRRAFTVQADGSDRRAFPNRDLAVYDVSPDGATLLLTTRDPNNNNLLRVLLSNVDGSNLRTTPAEILAFSGSPRFTRDGASIVVMQFNEIRQTRLSDGVSKRLRSVVNGTFVLDVSRADGSIVCEAALATVDESGQPIYRERVFLLNPDGSRARLLTNNSDPNIQEYAPSFSPDGRQIVFTRVFGLGTNTRTNIATINVDGSNLHDFSFPITGVCEPKWR